MSGTGDPRRLLNLRKEYVPGGRDPARRATRPPAVEAGIRAKLKYCWMLVEVELIIHKSR